MEIGRIILGGVIGVLAVAAAPFTAGGSVIAGVSLGASLSGAGLLAAGAGVAGGLAGGAISNKDEKKKKRAEKNKFKEGKRAAEVQMKNKFGEFLKTQKKRDDFALLAMKFAVSYARINGDISKSHMDVIDSLIKIYKINICTPEFINQKINEIISSKMNFILFQKEFLTFTEGNGRKFKSKLVISLDEVLESLKRAEREESIEGKTFAVQWEVLTKNIRK